MSGTWIVCQGALLDTPRSGGFEFIGPFASEEKALAYCKLVQCHSAHGSGFIVQAIELLNPPIMPDVKRKAHEKIV